MIDLSNNTFNNNYFTSQLRNKVIPFNNGYVLLLPEHYKDNNISKNDNHLSLICI